MEVELVHFLQQRAASLRLKCIRCKNTYLDCMLHEMRRSTGRLVDIYRIRPSKIFTVMLMNLPVNPELNEHILGALQGTILLWQFDTHNAVLCLNAFSYESRQWHMTLITQCVIPSAWYDSLLYIPVCSHMKMTKMISPALFKVFVL